MKQPITYMYTPASSAGRLAGALEKGADVVIYDLEDAVAPSRKDDARRALVAFLTQLGPAPETRVHVRVNPLDSPWGADDLSALAGVPHVVGVRVPKVSSPNQVEHVAARLPALEVHALVEDATGLTALREICRAPRAAGVSLGDNDLRAVLHLTGDAVLDVVRTRLVIELAAAGKNPPLGSVYPNVRDQDGLYRDSLRLRHMGFSGRTAIHPAQLDPIRRAFLPTPAEVVRATEVIEAADGAGRKGAGAVALPDGRFVDQPFVDHARHILALAADD